MAGTSFIKRHSKIILSVAIAVTSTAVLSLSLTGLTYFLGKDSYSIFLASILLFAAFLFSSVRQLCYYLRATNKYIKIDRLANAALYFILAVLTLAIRDSYHIFIVISFMYFLSLTVYDVLTLTVKHKRRNFVEVFLIGGICFIFFIASVSTWTPEGAVFSLIGCTAIMALLSLISIILEAFSKMRFGTLKNIFNKTYAGEILLGLAFLIVALSVVFHVTEGIPYGDALWYCFAIVTTIGFGDVTVTSPLGRVLSVILGIYGIIVVALITSIIVNFYNEVKNENAKKEEKEIKPEVKEVKAPSVEAPLEEPSEDKAENDNK